MKQTFPVEFHEAFQRLIKSVPAELQNDKYLQETTKLYLSLGGDTLARQHIHNFQQQFPIELSLFSRPTEDENTTKDSESQSDQSEDTD